MGEGTLTQLYRGTPRALALALRSPLRRASGAEFAEQELKNLVLQIYDRTTGRATRGERC